MNSPISSETQQKPTQRQVCPEHGPFESAQISAGIPDMGVKPFWSGCPTCNDERKRRLESEEKARIESEKRARINSLIAQAAIPARFAGKTLDQYRATNPGQERALKTASRYAGNWSAVKKNGASLVLAGGPGTGKTHLACAIADHVIREHFAGAHYTTVFRMVGDIKSTYRHDSDRQESDVIGWYAEGVDLLLLDEVGVQVGSEHEKLLLFAVLDSRYAEMKPAILISNLNATDLENYLGHRIMDRFRECGSVVAFDWQSHRGRGEGESVQQPAKPEPPKSLFTRRK